MNNLKPIGADYEEDSYLAPYNETEDIITNSRGGWYDF